MLRTLQSSRHGEMMWNWSWEQCVRTSTVFHKKRGTQSPRWKRAKWRQKFCSQLDPSDRLAHVPGNDHRKDPRWWCGEWGWKRVERCMRDRSPELFRRRRPLHDDEGVWNCKERDQSSAVFHQLSVSWKPRWEISTDQDGVDRSQQSQREESSWQFHCGGQDVDESILKPQLDGSPWKGSGLGLPRDGRGHTNWFTTRRKAFTIRCTVPQGWGWWTRCQGSLAQRKQEKETLLQGGVITAVSPVTAQPMADGVRTRDEEISQVVAVVWMWRGSGSVKPMARNNRWNEYFMEGTTWATRERVTNQCNVLCGHSVRVCTCNVTRCSVHTHRRLPGSWKLPASEKQLPEQWQEKLLSESLLVVWFNCPCADDFDL